MDGKEDEDGDGDCGRGWLRLDVVSGVQNDCLPAMIYNLECQSINSCTFVLLCFEPEPCEVVETQLNELIWHWLG